MYTVYIYISHTYIYTHLSHIYIYIIVYIYIYIYIIYIIYYTIYILYIFNHIYISHISYQPSCRISFAHIALWEWQLMADTDGKTKQYGTSCPAEVPPGLSSSLLFKLWRLQGPLTVQQRRQESYEQNDCKMHSEHLWAICLGIGKWM